MTARLVQILLLLSGAILVQAPASGAQEAVLAAGDRIRVKPLIRPKDRVTASFIAVSADSLDFEVRGAVRRLALSDIKTLERSEGDGSHLAGTVLGAVTGAFLGAALGLAIQRGTTDYCVDYCGWGGAAAGFTLGAVGGGVAGYFLLVDERWAEIPVGDLRVGFGHGAIALQLRP